MEGLTPARSRDRPGCGPGSPPGCGLGALGSLHLGEGNVSHGGSRSEEGTVCAVDVLKRESERLQKSGGDTALVLDAHLQFGVMV